MQAKGTRHNRSLQEAREIHEDAYSFFDQGGVTPVMRA